MDQRLRPMAGRAAGVKYSRRESCRDHSCVLGACGDTSGLSHTHFPSTVKIGPRVGTLGSHWLGCEAVQQQADVVVMAVAGIRHPGAGVDALGLTVLGGDSRCWGRTIVSGAGGEAGAV